VPQPAATPKTFAEMLASLRSRVKLHATLGNTPALEGILEEANEYVFRELAGCGPGMIKSSLTLTAGVATKAFITDDGQAVARGSVRELWVEQGDTLRTPLSQGISHAMRATGMTGVPECYDTRDVSDVFTLEVYPIPGYAYKLYVDHDRVLLRFSQGTDLPSAPSRLVFGYALAMAKSHYGQADAEVAGQSFRTMLSDEKYRQRENRRFIPPTAARRDPRVVLTAGGYRQVS